MKNIQLSIITIIISFVFFSPTITLGTTYYLSPNGDDSRTLSEAQIENSPWKTFDTAFSSMRAGDELVLLDGIYSEAVSTGYISYSGTYSAQPPSGLDRNNPTIVRAKTPGSVRIIGKLFLGRSTRKDSYIKIQDITFQGGGTLYNTSYIYLKRCGFAFGSLFVGTNDHDDGNFYNLIEDCWVFAENARGIAANYRADYNIWRRVVVRGDGCNLPGCLGSGNPNIGFTVYNSKYCSIQNVIIVDRILNGGSPYADFATAQHGSSETPLEGNEWLGCISINSEDTGYYFEADLAIGPSHYLKDCIVIAQNRIGHGFNFGGEKDTIVENCTVWIDPGATATSLFRRGSGSTGQITRNIVGKGNAIFGVIRGGISSHSNIFGSFSNEKFYDTIVSTCEINTDPEADSTPPSLSYPIRIEEDSKLKGAGLNGHDIGANVVRRYGVEGTFWGETDYNALTNEMLWPWPVEDRIKNDMREGSTRGFCAGGKQLDGVNDITLTSYIWESSGNRAPTNIVTSIGDIILYLQICAGITPQMPINLDSDIDGDTKIGLKEAVNALQRNAGIRQ